MPGTWNFVFHSNNFENFALDLLLQNLRTPCDIYKALCHFKLYLSSISLFNSQNFVTRATNQKLREIFFSQLISPEISLTSKLVTNPKEHMTTTNAR